MSPVCVRPPSSCRTCASPKSVIQTWPLLSSSRLAGLTSLCTTPIWWAWSSASAACTPSCATQQLRRAARRRRDRRVSRRPVDLGSVLRRAVPLGSGCQRPVLRRAADDRSRLPALALLGDDGGQGQSFDQLHGVEVAVALAAH